jgi:hypothetical protein
VKWEEVLQADKDHAHCFNDECLEEAIHASNVYESTQKTDNDYWISEHNANASISINNTFYVSV